MKFLHKKIPFFYTIIFAFLGAAASLFLFKKYTPGSSYASQSNNEVTNIKSSCSYNIARLSGYKYIRPLLDEASACESDSLMPLKGQIADFINSQKQSASISEASVYLRVLSSDDWISVNPAESYHPGSLFKLPVLITLLRMAETDPQLMNKKILYSAKDVVNVPQAYASKTIEPGKAYTVKELLTYMIAYSDNNATQLLNRNMNVGVLLKVFTDLGLTPPDTQNANYYKYTITPKDYSLFMEALYNASYLTIPASESATELLAQCNFKDGLVKELPQSVKIAHKFGESGTAEMRELHETGIIYLNNNAYLITVMTRGTDIKKLSETISNISRIAYNEMKKGS